MTFLEALKMTFFSPLIIMAAVILVGFRREIGGGLHKLSLRLKARLAQRPQVKSPARHRVIDDRQADQAEHNNEHDLDRLGQRHLR